MDTKAVLQRLEILRMAKELVVNDYIDRRAELHNQWLTESDIAWRSRKKKVSYPSIPPYPTEKEIVARARILLKFLDDETADTVAEGPVAEEPTRPAAGLDSLRFSERQEVHINKPIEPIKAVEKLAADLPQSAASNPIQQPMSIPHNEDKTSSSKIENNNEPQDRYFLHLTDREKTMPAKPVGFENTRPAGPMNIESNVTVSEPTGPVMSTSTAQPAEQCTGPTGVSNDKTTNNNSLNTAWPSPEEIQEFTKLKVESYHDEDTTTAGRLLPNVLKTLDSIRRGWNSN